MYESAATNGVDRITFASSACTYPTDIQQEKQRLREDMVSFDERGELELTHAIDVLVSENDAYWTETDEVWIDVGTVEDLLNAHRHFSESMTPEIAGEVFDGAEITGRVCLGDGSTVEAGAEIRGPVHVGENTSIGGEAVIGPYVSIGDRCRIERADVRSSVIMDDVEADSDVALERSVIGPRSRLSGEPDREIRMSLTVGADSTMTLHE